MPRLATALVTVCVLFGVDPPCAAEPRGGGAAVTLRPVDKATVRIVVLHGIDPEDDAGDHTGASHTIALGRFSHGSGVLVDRSGTLLTAAHVVEGGDLVAVLLPGEDRVVPAHIEYIDPESDLAFLRVAVAPRFTVPLPRRAGPRRLGEYLAATGYPLDVDQRYPAAVSGELSRLLDDGRIQIAMSVNPGNSGGPVVDRSGRLVGILSARGAPEAGVQGVAYVEPVTAILAAAREARGARRAFPRFTSADQVMAQLLVEFMRLNPLQRDEDSDPDSGIVELAQPRDAEESAVIAAYAWNLHLRTMEEHRVTEVSRLPAGLRERAVALSGLARDMAHRTLARAPYIQRRYTFLEALHRMSPHGPPIVPTR